MHGFLVGEGAFYGVVFIWEYVGVFLYALVWSWGDDDSRY